MEKFINKILYETDPNAISLNKLRKIHIMDLIDIYNIIAEENVEIRKNEVGLQKDKLTNLIAQFIARKYSKKLQAEGLIYRNNKGVINKSIKLNLAFKENAYANCIDDIVLGSSFIRQNKLLEGQKINLLLDSELNSIKLLFNYTPMQRDNFNEMTPHYPKKKFCILKGAGEEMDVRLIDIFTPVGYGQRGLIIAPPRAGKTTVFQHLAWRITKYNSNVHTIVLLVDERPEEITDMFEKLGDACEIMYSDFSETVDRHVHIAELTSEYAKRLAENKKHVVVFLDSLTRLTRAYNVYLPNNGKILTGGLDANSLQKAKKFFGAARYIDENTSFTIIATALIDTGSKMDNIISEELKGTGNMELYLDRQLANRSIYPAIDILSSGTRNEHLLLDSVTLSKAQYFRKTIATMKETNKNVEEIIQMKFKESKSNTELLEKIVIPSKNQ